MKKPLRILHLEDESDYSDLVQDILAQELVMQITTVSTREHFEKALATGPFDLILADYLLPDFDGLSALALAREVCPETPFVMLSGTLAESAAIETLKRGATDYVLKGVPERLVPTVRRALRESAERHARKRIERELKENERQFKIFTENALDVLTVASADGRILYSSPSLTAVLGYKPAELEGIALRRLIHPADRKRGTLEFQRVASSQTAAARLDLRIRHSDGSWRDLEVLAQNRLSDPEINGIVLTSHDATERKRAEQELRDSEQQYRLIFDGNPLPMWVFDQDTLRFLEVNDAAVQHYGYSRQEFLMMRLQDLRPASEDPSPLEYFHRLVREETGSKLGYAGVWRHLKKDRSAIEVEVKWAPIRFKGKKASLAQVNDITERKRIERRDAALSKLGQRLNAATHPFEAAQIIRSTTEELFSWDVFAVNLYLAETDEMIPLLNIETDKEGKRIEHCHENRRMLPGGLSRHAIQQGAQLIFRADSHLVCSDSITLGDRSHASASLMHVPIRNRTKVIGVLSIQSYETRAYTDRDLQTLQTLADHCGGAIERLRAEQALRESELRFKDLFEGSPDGIVVMDLEGYVLDINPAGCTLHGGSRDTLKGKHASALAPQSAQEDFKRIFPNLVSGALRHMEVEAVTEGGRQIPAELSANRVNYLGKSALLVHIRDISERKRSEEALRSSEMLFHSVWENSADGMRLTDEEGTIVAVNDAFCTMVCMSREELEGKPLTAPYAVSQEPERILRRYRERFQGRITERRPARTLILKNGSIVTLEDTDSFVERKNKQVLQLSVFRDVTAQRKLQEQLRQSQKMEAIGQLAGGVAHDFNNILTVIHGHASLLANSVGISGPCVRSAQQIVQAADRAAGLTRQLLTFGRRQIMQPRRLDVNELVGNLTKMLSRILGEDIVLKLQYSRDPAIVLADAGMIEQVLLNLAVNSRDAMPKGGVLFLKISIKEITPSEILEEPDARPGRFVCLSALDTGCGIPPENLKRVFEPFFTTKPVGKGTGLGLATVYGIVNQHQGWIQVESAPNQGAEFKVYLPWRADAADPVDDVGTKTVLRGGKETILVVEDEEPVRELVCNLLVSQGYRILKAESGPKALEVWRQAKSQIDLLLTDIVMPEQMNGRELAEKLRTERPELKVIFTSGYSAEVAGKEVTTTKNAPFLQKPYQPHRLIKTVRECLDTTVPAVSRPA